MERNEPTKLTLKHYNEMSWEGPWDANLGDLMTAFVGCLRGVGFGEWVVRSIRDWCNEQLPEEDVEE